MRHILPLTLCGLLSLSACAATQQQPPRPAGNTADADASPSVRQAVSLLEQSTRTLREMRRDDATHMLDTAIAEARALIVLPGIYQAGFIYSVRGGSGVLVARRADGGWGAPVFVGVAGAGYGYQVGLEKSRLVLAIMDDEMLARILDNGLNFDASAKFDVVGVREETSRGSLTEHKPVQAFTDGVGLMAGVAMHGGALTLNRSLTQSYHGAGKAEEIMHGVSAPGLEVFAFWAALGVEAAGPEIVKVRKP